MHPKKSIAFTAVILLTSMLAAACGQTTAATPAISISDTTGEPAAMQSETAAVSDSEDISRPEGWGNETHDNSADPNYEVVFPEDEVNTLTITIDPDDWQAMLDDMTALYGEPGSMNERGGQQPGQGQMGGEPPALEGELPGQDQPPGERAMPGGNRPGQEQPGVEPPEQMADQGGRGQANIADFSSDNPIWVPAVIQFEGNIWTDVGVRFKGNSSLKTTWSNGSLQLPFKLDFDEFEDQNPAIDDQRFYGFKQLSLSNNFNDNTYMRDTIASDIFEEAGIASAQTAIYDLYVDYGEGPVSFGLYTMIEVIDDTVIDRCFGSDEGNIYEAEGTAASLAEGTFDRISSSFLKENNEEEADWSDIETLYTALHADNRVSDPDAWKAELESVFDVDTFLHWLAINTVMENWDTYGGMTHNYYLYNNPETGQLTWVPWDHNEALNESKRTNVTFSMEAVGSEWPLIRYLLDESEYRTTYVDYIDETISTVFTVDSMMTTCQELAALIEPYASAEIGSDAFNASVEALIRHIETQIAEAELFLDQENQ